ncbi:hypothetical protein PsorP6_015867 [Peronosclerospora sorghi]|uniref:Uncharacterized protein n=1 Tax=Peronosclerospora sorghi TaxID=230839 RepID=A0ACC0WN81_9STRA|nr:hypothetical protein PsorP6_015867 [Peronosclerospora sorghi]
MLNFPLIFSILPQQSPAGILGVDPCDFVSDIRHALRCFLDLQNRQEEKLSCYPVGAICLHFPRILTVSTGTSNGFRFSTLWSFRNQLLQMN